MNLTLADVSPLLARPLKPTETARANGWIAAIDALLNARYKGAITPELEPFFWVKVADAVQRRLDKPKQMVESESAGPFSARWSSASTLGSWFGKPDLEEMDAVTGMGGARTYRTPAPDHIRFNNRMGQLDVDAAASELEAIANTTIRGSYVPPS